MLQVARTIGMGTARIAEANRELVSAHADAARRHRARPRPALRRRRRAHAADWSARPSSTPIGPHMLEQIRRDVIGTADLASGEIGGDGRGRRLLRRPGRVHQARRGDRARGAGPGRRPPGGDGDRGRRAAGAAGEDDRRRGDAGLDRGRADADGGAARWSKPPRQEGEEFPSLRAGVACGPALPQAATTTAARSTWPAASPASPGPAASSSTRRAGRPRGDAFDYSFAGERRLKGIEPQGQALPRPRREAAG